MDYTYTTTGSFPWALFLITFLIGIAAYIYTSYCFMKTADRLGVPNGWFAFIPFLNLWLFCQMGDRDNTWFILMLIFSFCCGIVTFVMVVLIFMDVAEKLGFESYWGILLIIPIFNFYVVYKFAFGEP
ncbi:MAG: hypothetical protein KKF41_12410 [Actinobacteria bacterium]|nr:hypothetical protein [Actinomycetota bacterium]MBU1944230.1 hypothetical protein [Actinomycetota bacterium]MBU2688377.1 hypothetical protein [Actinomycetota bacterium]